jgi:uncharacterized membrane protein YkvA (DUF1232 family)
MLFASANANDRLNRDKATVERDFWDKFRRLAAQIPFAEELLTGYYCAFDRKSPNHVRAALIGALAYFVSPFDVLPDFLPIVGLTDDAAVLAAVFKIVYDNLQPEHREAAQAKLREILNSPKPR